MDFRGETKQDEVTISSSMDSTRNIGGYHDAELASFFKRPVRIYSGTWVQGSAFNVILDPWALYFADPRVINRVTHFHLLRCSLCVKFVLNGNPFLYGQLMVTYMPYPNETSNSTTTPDGRNPAGSGLASELVLSSQRPKLFLTPMMSEGGCMRLPFFNYNNWFQTETADWVDFGKIIIQCMNQLKHANGGSESISLNIFAWAEDVELSVPTSSPAYGLVTQAGPEKMDEYGGMISKPATALSKAVARARNLPLIGPYAMATSLISGAVAEVSNVLGYSRPVDLDIQKRMVNDPIGGLAATDLQDTTAKLTVDSKQGVSIDTRVMGLNGADEMGVLDMAQVDSYLTTFNWAVGGASDSILFSIPVTPMTYAHWNATAAIICPTAIAAATAPFRRWRGTIIYRFQVVCTAYHKGRLRILYDPYSQAGVTRFNTNYTKIVDLSETTEFELAVSWASNGLTCAVSAPNFLSTTEIWKIGTIATPALSYENGVITVTVLNQLTAPQDAINNDVGVNVFVRAGEDFELYVPTSDILSSICMVNQTEWETFDNVSEYMTVGNASSGDDIVKVLFGERIISFRALLKRYNYYLTSYATSSTVQDPYASIYFRNFPLGPGSDTSGLHGSTGLAKSVNFVGMTLLAYLSSMFVAYRGALRYKHTIRSSKSTTLSNMFSIVHRDYSASATTLPTVLVLATTTASGVAYATSSLHQPSLGGSTMSAHSLKPCVEVELPFYSNVRFIPLRPLRTNATGGECHRLLSGMATSSNIAVDSWIAIGEDFTMGFFVGSNLWYSNYLVA